MTVDEQRTVALRRANEIRVYRRVIKEQVAAAETTVAALLDPLDDRLETMKVVDLLAAVPGLGKVRSKKWVSEVRFSPSAMLGSLTARQRGLLAALDLRHHRGSETWRRRRAAAVARELAGVS